MRQRQGERCPRCFLVTIVTSSAPFSIHLTDGHLQRALKGNFSHNLHREKLKNNQCFQGVFDLLNSE
jgi:hypothetical protein